MADRNGYIGRAPSDSAVTVARQTFSPTGVTTDFTFASGYTSGFFDVFVNGVKMIEGSDYTSTDGSTFSILNGGAISGDVIEGVAYKAFNAATATVGINSSGTPIGSVNTLNFVGTGNTFALRGSSIDISISGGGAGAGGTWANYDSNAGVSTTKKVKIENNLEVTGVTTSTGGFVGDVTGNASGTAGGLTGTPNITVGNISASGGDLTIRNITGVAATFTGVLTYEDVTNVDSVGLVTARTGVRISAGGLIVAGVSTFSGVSNFNNTINVADDIVANFGAGSDGRIFFENSENEFHVRVPGGSGKLTLGAGAPVQITNEDGNTNRAVFDATGARVTGIVTATGGVQVGSGQSFGANGPTAVYYGDGSNLTNLPAAGITTQVGTGSGIVTSVFLSDAVDHKITATGFCTITSAQAGTEGESHTIRIVNSGIATVGFSTYFLFPSGSAPTMPTADGAVSLISFTVHDSVGAGCTQLLAGASVNFS